MIQQPSSAEGVVVLLDKERQKNNSFLLSDDGEEHMVEVIIGRDPSPFSD
jgi:hypothetical protein